MGVKWKIRFLRGNRVEPRPPGFWWRLKWRDAEIAGELCLSVTTIRTYRTRILEKMQLTSNADLMRYAARHKLINLIEEETILTPGVA